VLLVPKVKRLAWPWQCLIVGALSLLLAGGSLAITLAMNEDL
jgi:hypothetical protein